MSVRAIIQKIYANRKNIAKGKTCERDEGQEILNALSGDYQETILFLKTATMEEIAIAIEVLCPLVKKFPHEEIIEIFKQKQVQYKKVNKICKVSYEDKINDAERIILEMKEKENVSLKEKFREILVARETGKLQDEAAYITAKGYEHEEMCRLLCRDCQETIDFLWSADKKEIAVAIEILDNLVDRFKSWEIIEISKKKAAEFPDVNDICEYDYFESIEEAESYLKEL